MMAPESTPGLHVPRVLIVDDDEDLGLVLGDVVTYLGGGNSVIARSLEDVQQHADEAVACSLAIIDINLGHGMPTGVDVVHWLRSRSFRGRVVFLTGHASDDPKVITASKVADTRLLSKPIDASTIESLLRESGIVR